MKFTHLHVHSHYSLLDGLPKIDELLDYAKELGQDAVALTDHGVIYGAVEFCKKAKEKGIKPILGCEMYLSYEGMEQKRPNIDDKRYHLVLLVKNEKGYKNLVKLITKAHLEGFYYKPRIDENLLAEYSEGLIGLSACLQGKISQLILSKKIKEAEKTALKYKEIFGEDNFYLELQSHPNIPEQKKVNKELILLSKKTKIPLVATNDSHYLKPEDAEAQDILMLINTGAKPDDPERLTMKADDFSLRPAEKMIEDFKEVPQAVENTQKIQDLCNFQFELGKVTLPQFKVPSGITPDDYLTELCERGIKERNIKPTKEIIDRLNYELSVIKQTGFASYFLIVQDFVNWAKENRIVVGPGRGSVGGSLVAYLLNITNVDPLKYNLLFERFLNPGRATGLPDIDLDFTDRRRDEVIEYVKQKYGRDKVAQIITFGTMAARAVVRDVGRALSLPYSYCDRIAKMIPFGFTLDQTLKRIREFHELYESDEKARRLIELAKKLEGVARHASTHACGVVISANPLENIVPLQHPTQDEKAIVTQYEMHSVEDLGLLKMDFLGLKNLTIIEDTLARIYVIHGKKIDIENIPLDDKKTYKLLQEGETIGVFQLECLSGDTIVSNTTIKKLFDGRKNKKRLASIYLDEGKVHLNQIVDIFESGEKDVYLLIAENNWYIKSTQDHYFLTKDGWKKLEEIKPGEEVLIRNNAKHLLYNTCQICGKQISGQKEGKSNFCYRCSASFYKNPSKKESREKIKAARIKFYQQGGKPWNYGITTENNEIWKKTAEKISKALRGRTLEDLWGEERAENFKRAQSERSRGKNNPMFGKRSPHRKGGFREDLGHYVRSTWEADFARILKLHNLDYQYEPKTFQLIKTNGEIVHYTPDFYVPSKNTFYEIKGFLRDLDAEKIELFQQQYPKQNLAMINTTKFAEFALKYRTLVNWECPRVPKQGFRFIKVKEIKYAGREKTYDVKMRSPGNNFQANGFIVHNSDGMRRYLKQLKPTEFEDIVAMIALYRPGPMAIIPEYIARKYKKRKVEYFHPKLKPILENTYGLPVYQESLMKIAQELAGFSLSEADILRKAIGKKIKSLLVAQKEKMINGMAKNGIEKEIAQKIWEWVLPFASYGFNKSHSACYAIIAYQTAYLKSYYPVEFMSALLTSEKADIERIGFLIEECKKMRIEVLPPDINESLKNFTVTPDKEKIRFGLLAIKNVGYNVVEAIIEERKRGGPYQSILDFVSRVGSKDLNKKSLESLIKAGVFDKLGERNRLLTNLEKLLEAARETQKMKTNGQRGLFDGLDLKNNSQTLKIVLTDVKPATLYEKLSWEKELLGLYISGHPLENLRRVLEKKATTIKKINQDLSLSNPDPQGFLSNPFVKKIAPGNRVRIGGIISNIKKILTKIGKPMLFLRVRDLTDNIEVVVFPAVAEKNPAACQENKIIFISGRIDMKDEIPKIIADDIEEVLVET